MQPIHRKLLQLVITIKALGVRCKNLDRYRFNGTGVISGTSVKQNDRRRKF